jgi:hypothetical protein
LATPELYSKNPFRVLGLRVDAKSTDIRRAQQRRRMRRKLGVADLDLATSGPFGPSSSGEEQQAAEEQLTLPISRFLAEVFWFWPEQAESSGFQRLQEGDVEGATRTWEQASDGEGDIVSLHNLAVLYHCRALDEENGDRDAGESSGGRALEESWQLAFHHWRAVVERDDFWDALDRRANELNDALLSPQLLQGMRRTFPKALLTVNATIAYAAATSSDAAGVHRQITLMKKAGFPDPMVEDAIREAVTPLRERIRSAIETARKRWGRTPHRGNEFVRELVGQTKPLLEIADRLLVDDALTRASIHDAVADAILAGQVAFAEKTDDWRESAGLLRLAMDIALGDTLRDTLAEQIGTLDENEELGNDWCAPGYWELPEGVLAELEAARDRARAGDFEGAIDRLLVMDPSIGRPLSRALSFALSVRGIRAAKRASSEYNQPTGVLREILDTLEGMSDSEGIVRYRRPDPNSPAWSNPPCLCCGRTGYTRWANFTYREMALFMCGTCSTRHDRELAEQKRTLCSDLSDALQYVILADEVDPKEKGVRLQLKSLKEAARKIGCPIPSAKNLRARLAKGRMRGTNVVLDASPGPGLCHFCEDLPGDDSASIRLPMCGDVASASFILGDGVTYGYGEVVIPRCPRCRDEHRELPDRIRAWEEARSAAAEEDHFPELQEEIQRFQGPAKEADASVEQARATVAAAEASLVEARAVGSRCHQCGEDAAWDDALCRRCDEALFHIDPRSIWLAFGLGVAILANLYFGYGASFLHSLASYYAGRGDVLPIDASAAVSAGALGATAVLVGLLLLTMRSKVRRVRTAIQAKRLTRIAAERRTAVDEARSDIDSAEAALEASRGVAAGPRANLKKARSRLRAAQARALRTFDAEHPKPALTPGVAPEAAYLRHEVVQRLVDQGWGFGSKPGGDGQTLYSAPVDVSGLVSQPPVQAQASSEDGPTLAASRETQGHAQHTDHEVGEKGVCVHCGCSEGFIRRFQPPCVTNR